MCSHQKGTYHGTHLRPMMSRRSCACSPSCALMNRTFLVPSEHFLMRQMTISNTLSHQAQQEQHIGASGENNVKSEYFQLSNHWTHRSCITLNGHSQTLLSRPPGLVRRLDPLSRPPPVLKSTALRR